MLDTTELLAWITQVTTTAVLEERERCAKVCDARATACSEKADTAEYTEDAVELKAIAWQFSVLADEIRKGI